MAIDTRNRRASCVGYAWPNLSRVWPDADGSLASQADRQHMAWIYPGIAAGAASNALVPRLMLMGAGCWWLWMVLR